MILVLSVRPGIPTDFKFNGVILLLPENGNGNGVGTGAVQHHRCFRRIRGPAFREMLFSKLPDGFHRPERPQKQKRRK